MNKRWLIAAAALAAFTTAQAQDTGNWIVRARAVNLDAANKDSTGNDLSVNNKVIPEVDITYFYTPNVAVELVLTYPQKHDLRAGGVNVATLKHLPPTLSAQYHFTGLGAFRPYLGAGINYTHFSSVNVTDPGLAAAGASIKKNSYGLSLQAGVDVPMGGGWLLNVDIKKVQISTKVLIAGVEQPGKFKVDPVLFGIGVGKRF
ncbi:outer membrane protein W [Burkholderiales bacterium JOSHI_001]|nr:outer membrane protein W [Burkholderiales bacterium JOSHI_001]